MNMMQKAILACALICLVSCRSRPESSATEAVETTAFRGRVAIFDVYDKDKRLTRQAPGLMVSHRGVLMPGMSPDETVVLADAQRRGERYIPLPAAKGSVVFIGLEEEAPKDLGLVPATVNAVPPLSAQILAPYVLKKPVSEVKRVFMYNKYGYVIGFSIMRQGLVEVVDLGTPMAYPTGGLLSFLYDWLFNDPNRPKAQLLSEDDALKMLRKGGAIISRDTPNNGVIVYQGRYWKEWILKGQNQTSTIDILAYVGEDSNYSRGALFKRKDLLDPIVRTAVEGAALKQNVPREVEQEILKYLGCYKP